MVFTLSSLRVLIIFLAAALVMTGTPSTSTLDHIVFLSPPGTLGETRKKFLEYGFE